MTVRQRPRRWNSRPAEDEIIRGLRGLRGLNRTTSGAAAKRPVSVRNGRRERKPDEPVARAHAIRFAHTRGCAAPPDVRAPNRVRWRSESTVGGLFFIGDVLIRVIRVIRG